MSVPTYCAVAFVADNSAFSIAAAGERFRSPRWFRVRVEIVSDKELRLFFGRWRLTVLTSNDDFVVEARETAKACPDYVHAAEVANCKRMVSVFSRDPDPEMNHFNDYLLVIEELVDSFPGFFAMDEASGEWFDESRSR
jgi:hypothetical protein